MTDTIFWRRLDTPGHEFARLRRAPGGWALEGQAAFLQDGTPCSMTYSIATNEDYIPLSGRVSGWLGEKDIRVSLERSVGGVWAMNGLDVEAVEGCLDLDLGFSPSTNTLALLKAELPVDTETEVISAYLAFPELTLEPLRQTYRRTGEHTYAYESPQHGYAAELRVNAVSFVVDYPGLWAEERH
jgi:hypothetical protein